MRGEAIFGKRRRQGAALLLAVGLGVVGAGSVVPRTGATADTMSGEALQIGLVTDLGQLNDRGFNQLAYEGLKLAQKRLGVDGRVSQAASAADYIPNMASLARRGFDLVVAVGFAQGAAVDTVATRFPNTRFAIIDVDQRSLKHRPKNVLGLLFREQEAGYLAGYAAALAEKRRPGADVLSSVGGVKEPPVDRFIAGYQAGAKRALPGIRLLNGYSQDWEDQAKCKELALDHIAKGAGVLFQVAGACGLGVLNAAKERRVWGIGVDADQAYLGPHVLTSAMKKVDRAVFLTIQSVKNGNWRGGRNAVFGLRQGGVGLGTFSGRVPRNDIAAVNAIEAQIAAGKIRNIPTKVG